MGGMIVQRISGPSLGHKDGFLDSVQNQAREFSQFSKAFAGLLEPHARLLGRIQQDLGSLSEVAGQAASQISLSLKGHIRLVAPIAFLFPIPTIPKIAPLSLAGAFSFCIQEDLDYSKQRIATKKKALSAPATHMKRRKWHQYFPALQPPALMSEDDFDEHMIPYFGGFLPKVKLLHLREYAYDLGISVEDFGEIEFCKIAGRLDQREDYLLFKAETDSQIIDAQVIYSRPSRTVIRRRLDQDRVFVNEGVEMLNAGEAASINHAANILISKYGWTKKGLQRNSTGKIVANSEEAARSRLWKKNF